MYSLIVFITLVTIQGGFIYWKWSDIKDHKETVAQVAELTGVTEKTFYQRTISFFGFLIGNFKNLLIIPISLLLVVNAILSLILGTLIWLLTLI